MAWQSGGTASIPGLTSDGANGVVVQDAIQAGNLHAVDVPDFHLFFGSILAEDAPANIADGDVVAKLLQSQTVTAGGFGLELLHLERSGNIAAADYQRPMVWLLDTSGSTQPILRVQRLGTVSLEIGTRKSITGALSTVTDAAAKAVLTSIVATLTGIKVADNNTT